MLRKKNENVTIRRERRAPNGIALSALRETPYKLLHFMLELVKQSIFRASWLVFVCARCTSPPSRPWSRSSRVWMNIGFVGEYGDRCNPLPQSLC